MATRLRNLAETLHYQRHPSGLTPEDPPDVRRDEYTRLIGDGMAPAEAEKLSHYTQKTVHATLRQRRRRDYGRVIDEDEDDDVVDRPMVLAMPNVPPRPADKAARSGDMTAEWVLDELGELLVEVKKARDRDLTLKVICQIADIRGFRQSRTAATRPPPATDPGEGPAVDQRLAEAEALAAQE